MARPATTGLPILGTPGSARPCHRLPPTLSTFGQPPTPPPPTCPFRRAAHPAARPVESPSKLPPPRSPGSATPPQPPAPACGQEINFPVFAAAHPRPPA